MHDRLQLLLSAPRSVAENLAIDEAMTRAAAAERRTVLRLWWGGAPTVVLGRSERPEQVVDLAACRRLGVEIVQRPTGGGTVLQTDGVLNYSLTCPAPPMLDIRATFSVGARLLVGALDRLGVAAEARGISDVAVGDRKISGNAIAKRWGGLLLHGTLLLDLDLELVESCLRHPPREPNYRRGRGHRDFLTTLRALGLTTTRSELEAAVLAVAGRMAAEGAFRTLLIRRPGRHSGEDT